MKNIHKILSCLLLFSVIGCQQNKYHIDGHITGMKNGSYIMLFKFSGDTISSVDTTTIENNQFVFEGTEFLDDIAVLTAGNYPDKVKATELVLDRGNIHITVPLASVKCQILTRFITSTKTKACKLLVFRSITVCTIGRGLSNKLMHPGSIYLI